MQVQDDKPYDDINITPMLDLAYVLLVIFILMTTASVQGLRVSLPKANPSKSKPKEPPKTKIITVDKEGRIKMDQKYLSLAELESALTAAKAANPEVPVVIKGDPGVPYQEMMSVIDVTGKLEIKNVGLAN